MKTWENAKNKARCFSPVHPLALEFFYAAIREMVGVPVGAGDRGRYFAAPLQCWAVSPWVRGIGFYSFSVKP